MPIRSKKKAFERDVVALLRDLPNTEFKRGQRGIVVSAFYEPKEAYDLEVVNELGETVGFAYSVRPDQFENLSLDAFIRAMQAVEKGDLATTETELRAAVDLRPDNISYFVDSIITSFGDGNIKTGQNVVNVIIPFLRLALRIRPDHEVARTNLAIAFLKFGVIKANAGDLEDAFEIFLSALSIKTAEAIESTIKNNLAQVLTAFGEEMFRKRDFENGLSFFRSALLVSQNEITRRNIGLAYGIHASFLMESKNFDQASQEFERAEDSGVVIADFITCYGVCLAMKGDEESAQRAFNRALEVDPNNHEARDNLKFLEMVNAERDLSRLLFSRNRDEAMSFGHGSFQTPVWQRDSLLYRENRVLA